MSMHQVNLYLPELRVKKDWLTANTLAISAVGFTLLMLASVIHLDRDAKKFEKNILAVEQQQKDMAARISEIRSRPRAVDTMHLDRTLASLRLAIINREQIGQIIQGQNLGNEVGFSRFMNTFAQESLDTISLQRIKVSRGGSFVELGGLTNSPEDVPRYLQRLRATEVFDEARFGLLSFTHPQGVRWHEFALGFESLYQLAAEEPGQ